MNEKTAAEDAATKKSDVPALIHVISVASGILLASLITRRKKSWSHEGK